MNPEDNRAQLLTLTGAGRREVPELAAIADRNDEKFFACLDGDEKKALRNLLGKIASHHKIREIPTE